MHYVACTECAVAVESFFCIRCLGCGTPSIRLQSSVESTTIAVAPQGGVKQLLLGREAEAPLCFVPSVGPDYSTRHHVGSGCAEAGGPSGQPSSRGGDRTVGLVANLLDQYHLQRVYSLQNKHGKRATEKRQICAQPRSRGAPVREARPASPTPGPTSKASVLLECERRSRSSVCPSES